MMVDELLGRLSGVRQRGQNQYMGLCPSHVDRGESLSIAKRDGKILLHCFAGCTPREIVASLGLHLRDLFLDTAPRHHGQRAVARPERLDPKAAAFRFELGALDLRLRAERTLKAVSTILPEELEGEKLDRLTDVVARAYGDIRRAEVLEITADNLRRSVFQEKGARDAA